MRGDNSLVERSTAVVDGDYADIAVNVPRQLTKAWSSPCIVTRAQDSSDNDYYFLAADEIHDVAIFGIGGSSYANFTELYTSDGVPDGSDDYTFTKIADVTEAPFADYASFKGLHVTSTGNWLMNADADLFVSSDAGTTWTRVVEGNISTPQFSWCGDDGSGYICVGGYGGNAYPCRVWVSGDDGLSFSQVWIESDAEEYLSPEADEATNEHIHTVCWDPTSDHTAIIVSRGDENNAICYRIDGSSGTYVLDETWMFYDEGKAVEGITLPSGDKVSVQITNHNLLTGWKCQFYNIGGTVELNSNATSQKIYTVTRTDANNFTLTRANGTATDGDDFTAYTSGGVMRVHPVGLAKDAGIGQPTGLIGIGNYVYAGTEASGLPTITRIDLLNNKLERIYSIPRPTTAHYFISYLTGNCSVFFLRQINGIYFFSAQSDSNSLFSGLYASRDMEHWVRIRAMATANGSFYGYHDVGALNGKLWAGIIYDGTPTRWAEVMDWPVIEQLVGNTCEAARTNLLSAANANFEEAGNWAGNGGNTTVALSTDYALRGTKSLKVTIGANGTAGYALGPYVVAHCGYTPQENDYINFRFWVYWPEAHRQQGVVASLLPSGASGGATKITVRNDTVNHARYYRDGWVQCVGYAKVNSTFAGAEDMAALWYISPAISGQVFYIDCAEIWVTTTRNEYVSPYDEGAVGAESLIFPMAGCGDEWTLNFMWRPELGAPKQVFSGNIPVCRVYTADNSTIDVYWEGDAGGHRGKFALQRTLPAGAEAVVLSTEQYEPFFDDIVHIALGTDNANSKIYAKIATPSSNISIEDANTGVLQPTHMLLGTNGAGGGTGTFAGCQCFDTEFITDADELASVRRVLAPSIRRYPSPPGLLLPR
jgi:hypothetical protein